MNHETSFHEAFVDAVKKYSLDKLTREKLWLEIEHAYSSTKRHYHNLQHLENLFFQLQSIENKIKDWDVIVFSIAFHDIVYNVVKQNNEERSAERAGKILSSFLSNDRIQKCKNIILATKGHAITTDGDTNHFLDADLSILGSGPESYQQYIEQIREEYSIYPDIIYSTGRKKVIRHFLQMDRIYKTQWFFDQYEKIARANLSFELGTYL